MASRSTSGKISRKNRRQLWIAALAGFTLLSGLLFGNSLNAHILAKESQHTVSFDEGWKPFQDHLSLLSSRSAWLGSICLLCALFALPRVRRVVKRYFSTTKWMQTRPGLFILASLFVAGGVAGFWAGSLMDRIMSALDLA